MKKLPKMTRCIDFLLFRSASSFEEYANTNTLPLRIRQLAFAIFKKQAEIELASQGIPPEIEK